jgi:ComF family protein
MWSALAELVFPARCIGCQRRGTALCPPCRLELPYLPRGVCVRCASRRSYGGCRGCRRLSSALSWVRAPCAYAGVARAAVLNLKFRSGRYLVPVMGELLCGALREVQVDLIVPVPLSRRRLRERGFNQAELLAQSVAIALSAPMGDGVLSRTERPSQHTLTATRRLANLAGAVRCDKPDQVRGKRLLIVDDVITTGATVSACADTLAEAGASRICGLAFARDL